ncbi:uncharacterized protein PITG_11841 [Phytophthora infestans T30-4]|uniref:Uncharacterized protein n=1 Tax=Phytophthora infestans (strain T30-4) TaxID=403677 RepID=D0NHY0_PHYIT|nr:uncharacterized protein PITG_11841 [Phytophthora infestans T30-4]EEY58855.1 hypothetical protein PITG_11841 [Phytophthora infestans T30-4]|eukprot:XP_002901328.1 hypothetical protein PITG_11841 [Phytophthora infestans T30-4]
MVYRSSDVAQKYFQNYFHFARVYAIPAALHLARIRWYFDPPMKVNPIVFLADAIYSTLHMLFRQPFSNQVIIQMWGGRGEDKAINGCVIHRFKAKHGNLANIVGSLSVNGRPALERARFVRESNLNATAGVHRHVG